VHDTAAVNSTAHAARTVVVAAARRAKRFLEQAKVIVGLLC
jgi:hypothetical protein